MKIYLSITYKSFPDLSGLPKGKAERRFLLSSRAFSSSAKGIGATVLILLCGVVGLLAGLHFGPVVSAIGAGAGIFVGALQFNHLMHSAIRSELEGEQANKAGNHSRTPEAAPETTRPRQVQIRGLRSLRPRDAWKSTSLTNT